jgi:hypothetical protein
MAIAPSIFERFQDLEPELGAYRDNFVALCDLLETTDPALAFLEVAELHLKVKGALAKGQADTSQRVMEAADRLVAIAAERMTTGADGSENSDHVRRPS